MEAEVVEVKPGSDLKEAVEVKKKGALQSAAIIIAGISGFLGTWGLNIAVENLAGVTPQDLEKLGTEITLLITSVGNIAIMFAGVLERMRRSFTTIEGLWKPTE